jgi:hypothetical protein
LTWAFKWCMNYYIYRIWRAVFQESPEINGSNGNANDCPSRTDINGNSRILHEITGKLVTLNWHFNLKKSV